MIRFKHEMTKIGAQNDDDETDNDAKILKKIEEADAEIQYYTLANTKLNLMNDAIVDGATKLFAELDGEPDIYASLAGSTGVTRENMNNYLGVIEILIDDNLMKSIANMEWASSDDDREFDGSEDISGDDNKDLEEVKMKKLKDSKFNIKGLAKKARNISLAKDKKLLAKADKEKKKLSKTKTQASLMA